MNLQTLPLKLELEFRERVFYVCFWDAGEHLWSKFLKKGFGHCFVVEKLEFIYMMFDSTRVGLNVMIPQCTSDFDLPRQMMTMSPELRILEVMTRGDGSSLTLRPKLINCVSMIQEVIGVSFNFCITPHCFFKKLLKCNHNNLISVREIDLCQQVAQQQKKHQL